MTDKPRIVFVAGDLANGGGANRVIRDLSVMMTHRLDAEVTILSVGSSGAPSYEFPSQVRIQAAAARGLRGYLEIVGRLRRERPDAVIGSWTQENILLALGLLSTRIKLIVVEHTSWYFHSRWVRALRRISYRFASHVVVLNPRELRHYQAFLSNAVLLPNPVAPAQNAPGARREKLIVAIGHLEPRKNFADAIRAMALSGLEQSGWSLAIIGSGPEQAPLERHIAAAGLERTRIVAPTDDLASWYSRASLTLVTARLEVFSLVLAEAMAAGVIPIAFEADGPAFILEAFPAHLVRQGDVEAMAVRMREFAALGSPEALRAVLSKSIAERFSIDLIGRKWRALLESAA